MCGSASNFDTLLRRAQQGDKGAFGQLLDRFRDQLKEIANRDVGSRIRVRVDASDLVQRSLLSAIRKFDGFTGEDEAVFAAWLTRIFNRNVQDTIRMHFRSQKRTVTKEVALDRLDENLVEYCEADGKDNVVLQEEVDWVLQQIEVLPPDQRDAVKMRYLEALPLDEIAERMQRSKVAVAALVKRGLVNLRRQALS